MIKTMVKLTKEDFTKNLEKVEEFEKALIDDMNYFINSFSSFNDVLQTSKSYLENQGILATEKADRKEVIKAAVQTYFNNNKKDSNLALWLQYRGKDVETNPIYAVTYQGQGDSEGKKVTPDLTFVCSDTYKDSNKAVTIHMETESFDGATYRRGGVTFNGKPIYTILAYALDKQLRAKATYAKQSKPEKRYDITQAVV